MYRIIDALSGAELGIVNTVLYICLDNDECYIQADKETADGILLNGVPYALFGRKGIKGYGSVFVEEFDGSALIAPQQRIIDSLLISVLEDRV